MSKPIVDKLNAAKNDGGIVKLEFKSGELFGSVLGFSEKLAVLINESDFQSDGYTIVRIMAVKGVKPLPDVYSEIYNLEQDNNVRSLPGGFSFSDWQAVLLFLQDRSDLVRITALGKEGDETYFARIDRVTASSLRVACFDSGGAFAVQKIILPLNKLRSVSFGTRYLLGYSKYMAQN